MTILWISATLMLLVALALVLWPLISRRPNSILDQQDANLAVFRRRFAELESDHQAGLLGDDDFAEARQELEHQLLGDLGDEQQQQSVRPSRPAFATAAMVALLLPLFAVMLYLQLGSPAVLKPQMAAAISSDEQEQIAFIQEHLAELEAKVAADPSDLEGVMMLGRAYLVLQRFDDAVALYATAENQAKQQPVLLVDYAEALGYSQGGNLLGRPAELLQRALAMEPAFPKGLWLAGVAAMQADESQQARQYWQRLVAVLPPGSETAEQVQQLLADISQEDVTTETPQAPSAADTASLQVEVELAPELAAQVAAGSTVFVLARPADGPRAPLAVVRHPVERLPLRVTLDESMAMVPGMSLSQFPEVVVEARISRSGEAMSQAGDLVGYSAPIALDGSNAISIIINEVVN